MIILYANCAVSNGQDVSPTPSASTSQNTSLSPSASQSPTGSSTPSASPTSKTASPTPSVTPTSSFTPSVTPTASHTASASRTRSETPSHSTSPSPSEVAEGIVCTGFNYTTEAALAQLEASQTFLDFVFPIKGGDIGKVMIGLRVLLADEFGFEPQFVKTVRVLPAQSVSRVRQLDGLKFRSLNGTEQGIEVLLIFSQGFTSTRTFAIDNSLPPRELIKLSIIQVLARLRRRDFREGVLRKLSALADVDIDIEKSAQAEIVVLGSTCTPQQETMDEATKFFRTGYFIGSVTIAGVLVVAVCLSYIILSRRRASKVTYMATSPTAGKTFVKENKLNEMQKSPIKMEEGEDNVSIVSVREERKRIHKKRFGKRHIL